MNIVDPILFQCRVNGEQPAICAPGARSDLVTYGQLGHAVYNLTHAMLSLGFEPGQIVGLNVDDKSFHVALVLALARIGVVTVSCLGRSIPSEIGAAAIITDSSGTMTGAKRIILVDPDWMKGSAASTDEPRLDKADGDDVCRIFLTSGSTGSPKGVALSHRLLIDRNVRVDYAFGGRWPMHSRIYCDLGLSSEPGFRWLLFMLMRGGMIMFYGSDQTWTEQSLDLFKIQGMVTSPRTLGEHLKFYEHTNMRCSLDHILSMGGYVPPELLERVWGRMCPHVFCDYGATEVGSVASADLRHINDTSGRVGYVAQPAEAEIVDKDDNAVSANTEGTVRLRSPYMAGGYVGQPEASALYFRNGWFYPGDDGYLTPDGLLVITGRQETRINIGGEKINPERIEEVIRAFAGIDDAAVLTLPDAFGLEEVYALIQSNGVADDEALRVHCRSKLSGGFVPGRFITVERIPRNEAGKIRRGELVDLARNKLT